MAFQSCNKLLLNNNKMQHGHDKNHWHMILTQQDDKYLMISLSSSKSLKKSNLLWNKSIQQSFNSTIKSGSSQAYLCTEKLEWWSKEEIESALISQCSYSDEEWAEMCDTLWHDTNSYLGWLKSQKYKSLQTSQLISKLSKSKKELDSCFW